MIKRSNLYKQALAEMEGKAPDLEKVWTLLQSAHNEKDPHASYAIGTWYLHGKAGVVEKDINSAIPWLREAAAQKLPNALYDLAICFEKGAGVKKNTKRAFNLYLKAALNGDKQSVYEVGRCYYYGIGVKQDKNVAKIWYEHARSLG